MPSGRETNESDSDAWGAWKSPQAPEASCLGAREQDPTPKASCRRAREQEPAPKVCRQELRQSKAQQHPDRQPVICRRSNGVYRPIKPHDDLYDTDDYYDYATDSEDEEYYCYHKRAISLKHPRSWQTRWTRAQPSLQYVILARPATIVKNISPILESREFMCIHIAHVWCVI